MVGHARETRRICWNTLTCGHQQELRYRLGMYNGGQRHRRVGKNTISMTPSLERELEKARNEIAGACVQIPRWVTLLASSTTQNCEISEKHGMGRVPETHGIL